MAAIVTPFDKMFLTSIWIETLLYGTCLGISHRFIMLHMFLQV